MNQHSLLFTKDSSEQIYKYLYSMSAEKNKTKKKQKNKIDVSFCKHAFC